jgi:hypothetical protein
LKTEANGGIWLADSAGNAVRRGLGWHSTFGTANLIRAVMVPTFPTNVIPPLFYSNTDRIFDSVSGVMMAKSPNHAKADYLCPGKNVLRSSSFLKQCKLSASMNYAL